jgi:DNA (cytosine-5)-methyltransferase 1
MIRNLVSTGARSAEDPRADLWKVFMSVVEYLQPRAVLVENVPDLPSWEDGRVLMGFYESLTDLGYEVDARVLDAFQYGVPQHRARLFLVGLRRAGAFRWAEPTGAVTTLRDAIGDLPPVPPAQRSDRIPYYASSRSPFQQMMRVDVPPEDMHSIHDHITRDVRRDDAEAFALLGEGQTYMDLPMHLRRYRSDIFTDKYKRLAWSKVSRSITAHIAKDGYWYIHPQQHRTLSVREAARVQTFPDWFRFAGQPTLRLKQIGNAVPPLLAEALGEQLRAAMDASDGNERARSDFRALLTRWHGTNRRDHPWRAGGTAPWHVLAGELCLSRTRADRVPALYERLCHMAPSARALLERKDAGVELRSLGLGARAEMLLRVAAALNRQFEGEVPESEMELRSLPAVGDNLAQAVRCFAFGKRAVILDVTTRRLVERYLGRSDLRRWQIRLDLYRLAGTPGPDAQFNHALLDHGALVCRADAPRCEECPLARQCALRGRLDGPSQMSLTVEAVASAA